MNESKASRPPEINSLVYRRERERKRERKRERERERERKREPQCVTGRSPPRRAYGVFAALALPNPGGAGCASR